MNFMKYGISKNLLNQTVPPQNIYITDSIRRMGYEVTVPAGTYTAYGNDTDLYAKTKINGVYGDASQINTPLTLTLSSDGSIIIYSRVNGEFPDVNIMLNTGSTALPYEPYGNTWVDSHYIRNTSTDTLALPAVIYGDGTNATLSLKGNEEHTGTPSPQNPVMPQGTGERTGNLFDYKTAYASYINADGDVEATTLGAINNSLADFVGQTVTISVYCKTVTATRVYLQAKINGVTKNSNSIYRSDTGYLLLTVTPETLTDYWIISYGSLGTGNNIYSELMLNTGSAALSYEPYGYKIPILNNSQTTNVYLGEVETTRKIGKYVFTGQENWNYQGEYTRFGLNLQGANFSGLRLTPIICTHYITIDDGRSIGDVPNNAVYIGGSASLVQLFIKTDLYTSADDWKAYLAQQYANGTPVCVWYVLSTPQTAVVNEPLMKIGDYADTLSNISIPVTAGANSLSVGTTVQPSEVTASYHGWHPVAAAHEKSKNLYDMTATDATNGYISDGYLKSDGSKNANSDYRVSEDIAVSPNQSYTLVYGSNLNAPSVCFYDSSKNFISGDAYGGRWTVPFTTPQNTAFLRLSFRAVDYDTIMLNTGSSALPYAPYWD